MRLGQQLAVLLVATAVSVAILSGLGLPPVGAAVISLVPALAALRLWILAPMEARLGGVAARVRLQADADGAPGPLGLDAFETEVDAGLRQNQEVFEQLRTDRHMSRQVLRLSNLGVALFDDEGRFREVNTPLLGMFAMRADPIGKRAIEVVRVAEIHEMVEDAMGGVSTERTFPAEDRDLFARAEPLSEGVLLWVEDVTGQREAERSRADFVANVSHELRTPIAAVMGYLETVLLDVERIPEDLRPLLVTVDRNARRLRDLFEDLLRLHRIESRRRELPRRVQALGPVLEAALVSAADRAHMHGQDFGLICPEGITADINAEALGAIIANLASNATAYTPQGGTVRVEVFPGSGGARIDVSDNGLGIAVRDQERIFERFYRVDDARSREQGGTGLGLAIVKHYALATDCTLSLESTPGVGTTFSVQLPAPRYTH